MSLPAEKTHVAHGKMHHSQMLDSQETNALAYWSAPLSVINKKSFMTLASGCKFLQETENKENA
jgi:hypothetical protein